MIRRPPSSPLFPYTPLSRSSLDQLSKQLEDYLRKYTPRRSAQHPFADEDNLPLELKHLKVVAFIQDEDRKSTRLNSSHSQISYAVFCLKKKKKKTRTRTQNN